MNPIIEHVRNAVVALCESRLSEAEQALCAIDFPELRRNRQAAYAHVWGPAGLAAGFNKRFPGTKRKDPSPAEKRAIFIRDRYTCRYSHCQRPTVSTDVLRLLSQVFPEILPYHPNWKDRGRHILYYTYSTNLEHFRSFTEVGPSAAAPENLITACYECGDIKNHLTPELLGWSLSEPSDTDWTGLTEYIPRLSTAIAALPNIGILIPPQPQNILKEAAVENPVVALFEITNRSEKAAAIIRDLLINHLPRVQEGLQKGYVDENQILVIYDHAVRARILTEQPDENSK